MLDKPEAHRKVKARNARQHAAARKACQDAVWKRAGSCCEICGVFLLRPREAYCAANVGHVHEITYRSRGGSDTDPRNCILLCPQDHEAVHARRFTEALLRLKPPAEDVL